MCVCPPVLPHGTLLSRDGFSWNLIFEYFSKICLENQSFIKIWQVNGYCMWRPIYIFDHISLSPSYNDMFQTKVIEKIKTHILCSVTFFENRAVNEIMWNNTVYPDRPQMTIWRMHIACWITKIQTHTHNVQYLLPFHGDSGCTNEPLFYVVHTVPVLLNSCGIQVKYWLDDDYIL